MRARRRFPSTTFAVNERVMAQHVDYEPGSPPLSSERSVIATNVFIAFKCPPLGREAEENGDNGTGLSRLRGCSVSSSWSSSICMSAVCSPPAGACGFLLDTARASERAMAPRT
jgi:hypothetical protein